LEIYKWFGLVEVLSDNVGALFSSIFGALKSKKAHKGMIMIWNAILWVIWKTRNDAIFTYKIHDAQRKSNIDTNTNE
jgi:hypothetical protein